MKLRTGTSTWSLADGSAMFCATGLAGRHGSPVQSATATFRQDRRSASPGNQGLRNDDGRVLIQLSKSTISLASTTELATQVGVAAIPMDLNSSRSCNTYRVSTTVSGYLTAGKEETVPSEIQAIVANGFFVQPLESGRNGVSESVPVSGLYGRGGN
jgi:hypothetical protein